MLNNHLTAFVNRPVAEVAQDARGVEDAVHSHARGKHMLVVLRNTCKLAVRDGLADAHRLDGIPLARSENVEPADFIPATREQVGVIAASLGRNGLSAWLMYGTGMRVSEALAARPSDFHPETAEPFVRVARQNDRNGKPVPLKARRARDYREVPTRPGWWRLSRPTLPSTEPVNCSASATPTT